MHRSNPGHLRRIRHKGRQMIRADHLKSFAYLHNRRIIPDRSNHIFTRGRLLSKDLSQHTSTYFGTTAPTHRLGLQHLPYAQRYLTARGHLPHHGQITQPIHKSPVNPVLPAPQD